MSTEYIEVSKLVKSPLNVRRTVSKASDKELKASILAHGLMQNLVVTEGGDGTYQVIAGARRLAALQDLIQKKKLPADHAVPCQFAAEEDAAELSLAENTVRQAMHPADEFEAFASLSKGGKSAEFIAARFGVTVKHVQQRLRLGRVAPEIRQAYRDEKLNLDALMAYALTDDHTRQLRVYESLKGWQASNAPSIRRSLTDEMVEAESKLAKFVGMEAYQASGGTVEADLFGEDVYLEDAELVSRLAGEKLEVEAEKLRQEGWSWVEVAEDRDYSVIGRCDRIRPVPVDAPQELLDEKDALERELAEAEEIEWDHDEEAEDEIQAAEQREENLRSRLAENKAKLKSFVTFTTEQMKSAGCYLTIDHGGELQIEKGLVKPEDKKAAAKAKAASGATEDATAPKGMPESLKRDLAAFRLGVAQSAIASHPAIAFDLLVFKVAKNALTMRGPSDGPNVRFEREFALNAGREARDFLKAQMEPIAEGLPTGWLEAESEADQFLALQQLTEYQKQALLAYCVAATLQPKIENGRKPTAYDVALAQTGVSVANVWRPTKDNFLGRVTKDQLLEIGKKLIGGERGKTWARNNANVKKGEIADEMHRTFAEPERPGMTPEQVERVKRWLPEGMAFMEAPEPKPAKAKKPKKAA